MAKRKRKHILRITDTREGAMSVSEDSAASLRWLSKASDVMVAACIAAVVFSLYFATLAPTIVAADAGELVTAAYELGIAHPPGYPLWCLLAHGFIVLLTGETDIAFRVNVMSAVFGALTCVGAYFVSRKIGIGRMASAAGALALGATKELWAQSVIAEVYTLNSFLFTVCVYCLLSWDKSREARWLVMFSAILGLGMTNHHTIGILGPIGLAFVLIRDWRLIKKWEIIAVSVAAFLLPLCLYMYLPLRSATYPYMDWGHPETIRSLWDHVTRSQYTKTYQALPRTLISVFFQASLLLRQLLDQFSPVVGMVLVFVAPVVIAKSRNRGLWAMVVVCVIVLVTYGGVLNTKFERQEIEANRVFFIPAYVCGAILLASVLDWASKKILEVLRKHISIIPSHLLCTCCLLVPFGLSVGHNYTANDFSKYWYADDHARNILRTIEPNGVLFPSGDHNTFPVIYLHRVKGLRPDVTIADKYGYVEARDFPEIKGHSQDSVVMPADVAIRYLLTQTARPVYFTVKHVVPAGVKVHQALTGLLYRLGRYPPEKRDTASLWRKYEYRNINDGFSEPPDYGAVNVVSDYFFFQGLFALEAKQTQKALGVFSRSAELASGIKEVFNNIGSALAENGLMREAYQYYSEALKLDDAYVNGLWNSARTASALGRADLAANHFERLCEVTPEDFRVHGELGFLVLRRFGNTKSAVEHLTASLELNPEQRQITETLAELNRSLAKDLQSRAVSVDRMEHDFGDVLLGAVRNTGFRISNVSADPVELIDARADCGCTVPTLAQKRLAPGESTKLEVRLQEKRDKGPLERHVLVSCSNGHILKLTVRANIVPQYEAKPAELRIDDAIIGVRTQARIRIQTNGKESFRIRSVESTLEEVKPSMPDPCGQGGRAYVMDIGVAPKATAGQRKGKIMVHIANEDNATIEIPVSLEARHPVRVEPPSLFLSSISRQGKKKEKVCILLPPQWKATVMGTLASSSWLEVASCPKHLEGQSEVLLDIDTRSVPRTFSGSVTLRTDHPACPVIIIPVYGYIRD